MADIIVQNAIGKVTEAINSGASGINYSGVFGKSLLDKVKEVMEASSTSGVYTVGSAGGRQLCDLSSHCFLSLCNCNYTGSGQNCSCIYVVTNVWTDGQILTTGGGAVTKADVRTALVAADDLISAVYDIGTTTVENDLYFAYLAARPYYASGSGSSNTNVRQYWYGIGIPSGPGQPLSAANKLKVCGTQWKCGEGATCTWTVPAGASQAKFQVWGAGGGSNPACCCGGAVFGETGAYAEMVISVTPGDQYTVCAGCSCQRFCCSNTPPGSGCMSGVTGNGICCLKADGSHCYQISCLMLDWLRVSSGAPGMPGGNCRRYQNPYCTTSGPCFCSYGEYCFANSCGTCGTVPILTDCCYTIYCNCATTAAVVSDGANNGYNGIIGGGCLDTNNYGWHTRPPILDSDTGSVFGCTQGCSCAYFSSNCCCGGCNGAGWNWHPGHGGAYTHTMGGNNTHRGDTGRGGMVQISWN